MTDSYQLKMVTAVSSVAAGLLILIASALATSAVGFDVDLLAEPENLIALGADDARVFRWSWLAALSYYLLLLPAVVYLDRWLGARSGMVRVWTMAGLGYVTVGAILLAIDTAVLPAMMTDWPGLPEAGRRSLEMIFAVVTDATLFGLAPLTSVLGGVWWLGIGPSLGGERPSLGVVTVILGVGTVASGLGFFVGFEPLARLELVYYLLAPVWAVWIGLVVARHTDNVVARGC